MSVIYKYNIPVKDEFELDIPKESKILNFQINNGIPCMWVIVNPNFNMVKRHFKIIPTGHAFEDDLEKLNYIGTVQEVIFPSDRVSDHVLVWHLFEVIKE